MNAMTEQHEPIRRVTDLIRLQGTGRQVTCKPKFGIYPVDFTHRKAEFQAYVFMCHYTGTADGEPYTFRKCYARGCPNNLCQHVSRAVMIANRHLQRDYRVLRKAGIDIEEHLFTLEQMMVEFDDVHQADDPVYTIFDFIDMAEQGKSIDIQISLEEVPAVEYLDYQETPQTFMACDFDCRFENRSYRYQRCLSCYATEKEKEERQLAIKTANARLENMYHSFDRVGITYSHKLFS